MKQFITTLIATLIFSSAYSQTCPPTYQGLPFYEVVMNAIYNLGVDCQYGHSISNLQTLPIGYESITDNYQRTLGPWKMRSPQHYTCEANNSSECGFEKRSH